MCLNPHLKTEIFVFANINKRSAVSFSFWYNSESIPSQLLPQHELLPYLNSLTLFLQILDLSTQFSFFAFAKQYCNHFNLSVILLFITFFYASFLIKLSFPIFLSIFYLLITSCVWDVQHFLYIYFCCAIKPIIGLIRVVEIQMFTHFSAYVPFHIHFILLVLPMSLD